MLVAHGSLENFVACYAKVEIAGTDMKIDSAARELLGAEPGSEVLAVGR
jgi:hypothetical protein